MIAIPMIIMKERPALEAQRFPGRRIPGGRERRIPLCSTLIERSALEAERFPWPHRGGFIRPRCAQRSEDAERRAPHPRSDVAERFLGRIAAGSSGRDAYEEVQTRSVERRILD